jgi:type IV secretory pathway VirB9-like protein
MKWVYDVTPYFYFEKKQRESEALLVNLAKKSSNLVVSLGRMITRLTRLRVWEREMTNIKS